MHGNIMSPMTAFLVLKTMGLCIQKQSESAMLIATFLQSHPEVEKCIYPSLPSFPQKEFV
jgi:methionine-gamma-lyase